MRISTIGLLKTEPVLFSTGLRHCHNTNTAEPVKASVIKIPEKMTTYLNHKMPFDIK